MDGRCGHEHYPKNLMESGFYLTGVDLYSGAKCGDFSFFSIELKAKYEEASKLLAVRGFTPREFASGETRLRIVSLEYRDVQIAGPYNEISIEFSIDPLDDSPGDKIAILFLPVTTEAARWPGVDIMGMPKFAADIDIKKEGSQMVSRFGMIAFGGLFGRFLLKGQFV